jgi:predicted transposase YdaD
MTRRAAPPPPAVPSPDAPSNTSSSAAAPAVTTPDADDFVHHPHDSFFKSIFGDPRNAAEVLRTALPPRVSAHIDWDSLQAVQASFVDDALKQRHGDLVYLARLRQGGDAFLWVLFEHQSSVEWWMSWRMLRMMLDTLEAWRVHNPAALRMPPVLPVVLYQGAAPWTAPTSLAELYELSDDARRDLGEYLLSFRYVLDNLQATPDEDITTRDVDVVTRVSLVTMKYARSEELLEQLVALARRGDLDALLSTEQGGAWWRRVVRYILAVSESLDLATLAQALTPITGPEMKETMLTYGQKMELELLAKVTKQARETVTKEAREEATRDLLLRLLTRRFGSLPADTVERVRQAGTHELEHWADRILDASSLEDMFATPLG